MKLKKYILVLGLASALTACNDDFMERNPQDKVTDVNFWKTENDLKLVLNKMYPIYIVGHQENWANTKFFPLGLNGSPLMYGDIYSDNCVKAGSEDPRMAGEYVVPTGASNTGWEWEGVRRINFFLTRYQKANISEELKNRYAAEAYFFKAWDYYKKVLYFGDVPWLTRDLNVDSEELYAPRTPRAEVMDSVLMCLNKAVQYLPEKGKEESGRLNKDQANFLKARICLFEGTFRKYHTELNLQGTANKYLQEAVTAAESLIGKYALYRNGEKPYWSMFAAIDLSDNTEVILARTYLANQVGHAAQRYFDQNARLDQAMGATRGLIDEYLCINGEPIYIGGTEGRYQQNPLFEGYGKWTELENRDPRLTQTVCRPGEFVTIYQGGVLSLEENGIRYPNLAYQGSSTVTGYRVIKHWMGDMVEQDRAASGIQSAIEFRYAEALLNYAEAKYELNGTLSQADIDKTINALRERAGFDFAKYPKAKLTMGQEPADPRLDRIYAEKLDYAVSPLLREIRRERRIELAIENHRYEDLMRWKGGKLFTVPLRGMKFNEELQKLYDGSNAVKPEIAPKIILNTNVWIDKEGFLICYPLSPYENTIEGTLPWSDYRYYFPLPKEELKLNPQLVQNEGWENR